MADADKHSDEYNRFERLLRRLAQVPKKVVDDLDRESSRTDPSGTPAGDDEAKGEQPE